MSAQFQIGGYVDVGPNKSEFIEEVNGSQIINTTLDKGICYALGMRVNVMSDEKSSIGLTVGYFGTKATVHSQYSNFTYYNQGLDYNGPGRSATVVELVSALDLGLNIPLHVDVSGKDVRLVPAVNLIYVLGRKDKGSSGVTGMYSQYSIYDPVTGFQTGTDYNAVEEAWDPSNEIEGLNSSIALSLKIESSFSFKSGLLVPYIKLNYLPNAYEAHGTLKVGYKGLHLGLAYVINKEEPRKETED